VNNSKTTYCRRDQNGWIKDADKELLKLGKQWAKSQPELATMLRWVDECGSFMPQRSAAGAGGRRIRQSGRGVMSRNTALHESVLSGKLKLAQPTSAQRTR
jgi:hypothetical protein